MAEIWLLKDLGVPLGVKISNPRKTQIIGPRANIFGILEQLPKGYQKLAKSIFSGFSVIEISPETTGMFGAKIS